MKIKRGSTSVRRLIFIADSSSATGAGLANLAWNTSGLVAYYFAGDLNNEVQITLASATLGSYTSGGFVAVDNTNMPGWYEVGIPDAALDGGNEVAIQYRGAANMVPVNVYIELDAVDYQDSTAFGLSRLDAAVSSRMATFSLPTNFAALGINSSGHVSRVTLVDTTTTNSDMVTASGIRSAVGLASANLDAQFSAIVVDLTPVLNRLPTALVGGRIDASVGSMATNTLTASALATDAVTEIATAVAATQALSRLDSMIESDGTGQFRFDAIAVSLASGGGSTDWTANERTAIRSIFGFDSNGTVSLPTVGVMDAIKDKTDLITSGSISVLPDRVNDNTITMQYSEVTTATVNLDENTTSATLQFVVARPDGTDVLTIANGAITRTSTSFTVTITTAVTATIGQYLWSLRDLTGGGNRVVSKGVLTVQNAAAIDA